MTLATLNVVVRDPALLDWLVLGVAPEQMSGSGDCFVWAGLVLSLLAAADDSCHEFAKADLLSEVALEPVHKPSS